MANKVKSLLGGPGFYAVLALCVLAVGVGGYFLLFGEPAQTEAPTGRTRQPPHRWRTCRSTNRWWRPCLRRNRRRRRSRRHAGGDHPGG